MKLGIEEDLRFAEKRSETLTETNEKLTKEINSLRVEKKELVQVIKESILAEIGNDCNRKKITKCEFYASCAECWSHNLSRDLKQEILGEV